jgi:hypothetical protein
MRRGQDWRTAGLLLIGRGHRVAKDATFRQLLDYLFTADPDVPIDDPLGYADDQIAAAAETPLFKRLARIAGSNISAAQISDPVTGKQIDAQAAAPAVMVRGLAGLLGEPMPRDAAEETAAAWRLIDAGLPPDVREHRVDFMHALAESVLTFARLAAAAQTVDPARLQSTIREFRQTVEDHPQEMWMLLPVVWRDTLIIVLALATVIIDDLGGSAWIEKVSPGLADAEATYAGLMNRKTLSG